VECAVTLRYLTVNPEEKHKRTKRYLDYFKAEKVYVLHNARSHFEDKRVLKELEEYAAKMGFDAYGIDPKEATKHWSGLSSFLWKANEEEHPLDSLPNAQGNRKSVYAHSYHGPSQYVHCSSWCILNYCPDTMKPYVAGYYPKRQNHNALLVILAIVQYLYECCGYVLFGLGMEQSSRLDELFIHMQDELGPFVIGKSVYVLASAKSCTG
jgi:hypothetical protein